MLDGVRAGRLHGPFYAKSGVRMPCQKRMQKTAKIYTGVNEVDTFFGPQKRFPRRNDPGIPIARIVGTILHPMLLQKTLHMNQSLDECKHRLASIQSYRRQFVMVTKATVTSSKTVDFSFRGPLGFEARTVLLSVESDSPEQFAFESTGGNLDVMGLVEFTEIRPSCTEVTLALHYEIKNRLFAWLDRRFHFVDAFVTSELRSIRSHFEGIAAPVVERTPMLSMFETATA
jgi:hypothetical protein